ncbi:MAG: integrase [Hyphomicrobium sp.]|nr:integrase [Hyphomicrobium sp.]
MDRNTFLGGSVVGVLVRLIVLSIVVGVVLSALGITPQNIFYQFNILLQRIYDLGFGAIESVLGYLILGAVVVVPVWFISRLIKVSRRSDVPPPPRGGTPV